MKNGSFMLDTDTCSFIIRGGDERLRSLVQRHAHEICVSSITAAELLFGAHKKRSNRILDSVSFLLELAPPEPWDENCARNYAKIRTSLEESGTPIGNTDMMIAAAAIAHGCTLVTHNTTHFSRVSGLNIADWTTSATNH
jgi:tRNA(fMet)-specific endonuclease VapC